MIFPEYRYDIAFIFFRSLGRTNYLRKAIVKIRKISFACWVLSHVPGNKKNLVLLGKHQTLVTLFTKVWSCFTTNDLLQPIWLLVQLLTFLSNLAFKGKWHRCPEKKLLKRYAVVWCIYRGVLGPPTVEICAILANTHPCPQNPHLCHLPFPGCP